jgi:hypothetical protein
MALSETHETIRQAIMRYRELMDVLGGRLEASERAYAALFAHLPAQLQARTGDKDAQTEAARVLLTETGLEPLQRGVLQMYYDLRDLERAFDDLHGNIANAANAED